MLYADILLQYLSILGVELKMLEHATSLLNLQCLINIYNEKSFDSLINFFDNYQ